MEMDMDMGVETFRFWGMFAFDVGDGFGEEDGS
jgi:hypothetical protein